MAAVKDLKVIANVKFAFVAYRDHPMVDGSFVTMVRPFCDQEKIHSFIKDLKPVSNTDWPEAVLDGLNDALSKLGDDENPGWR